MFQDVPLAPLLRFFGGDSSQTPEQVVEGLLAQLQK
jgi:hypothetical protein